MLRVHGVLALLGSTLANQRATSMRTCCQTLHWLFYLQTATECLIRSYLTFDGIWLASASGETHNSTVQGRQGHLRTSELSTQGASHLTAVGYGLFHSPNKTTAFQVTMSGGGSYQLYQLTFYHLEPAWENLRIGQKHDKWWFGTIFHMYLPIKFYRQVHSSLYADLAMVDVEMRD